LYRAPAFCPNADRFAQFMAGELAALRRKLGTTPLTRRACASGPKKLLWSNASVPM
jgi:hypothetical protein